MGELETLAIQKVSVEAIAIIADYYKYQSLLTVIGVSIISLIIAIVAYKIVK